MNNYLIQLFNKKINLNADIIKIKNPNIRSIVFMQNFSDSF